MPDRTFIHAMYSRGTLPFDWEFAVDYLIEAVAAYSKGITSSRTLNLTYRDVEQSVLEYEHLRAQQLPDAEIRDRLAAWAVKYGRRADSPPARRADPR